MKERTRNTIFRILSAVVGLPIYVFAIYTDALHAIPALAVSTIITTVTLNEYYKITEKSEGERAFSVAGLSAAVLINITMYLYAYGNIYGHGAYFRGFDARVIIGILVLFFMVIVILQVFTRPLKGASYSMGTTIFGIMYIVVSFSHIILMKSLINGFYYIFIIHAVIMLNDTGAYFGGVYFGRHKTGFAASPNKSWEGYFSGLLVSIIAMILTNQLFDSFFNISLFTMIEAGVLGIILSILGNTGDLIESVIKRDGSIKDSGSIIPGHGGMWDVFDSLIFTIPLFYYYLILRGVH